MSRAFTKENDDAVDAPPARRDLGVPPGTPSYLTPGGARAIRAELAALIDDARPEAVRVVAAPGAGTTVDAARRALGAIDQRIAELTDHLAIAEVVDPAGQPRDQVRFGAAVTLVDDDGELHRYVIVGVPEADPARHRVSFLSPVARALIGAAVGDRVTLRNRELEVTAIDYDEA